jgi:hypothetical protein
LTLEGWYLSGEAEDLSPEGKLRGVRTFAREPPLFQGYFYERKQFLDVVNRGEREPLLDDWLEVDGHIQRARRANAPQLVWIAKDAYFQALKTAASEFRVPEFVRSAETILALPNVRGQAEIFADRAVRMVPTLANDPYVKSCGVDLRERFVRLHRHRSDCVQGKIPFEELHAQGEKGKDQAALFFYIADALARACILSAIRRSDYSAFASRPALEDAWANGSLP